MIVSSALDAAGWDQYLGYACQLAIGLLFLVSSAPKLRRPAAFTQTVTGYDLVSQHWSRFVAPVVIGLEVFLALSFLSGVLLVPALPVAAGLILVFCAAAWTNLARGHLTVCGCFGDPDETISVRTVVRLGALLAAVIVLGVAVYAKQVSVTTIPMLFDAGPAALAYLLESMSLSAAVLLVGTWIYYWPDLAVVLSTIVPRWATPGGG